MICLALLRNTMARNAFVTVKALVGVSAVLKIMTLFSS